MFARPNEDGKVPAVDRAIRILKLVADSPTDLGVSEIGRALGLHKSTAHAILSTLAAHGLVARDPVTRRYRPGPGLADLSLRARPEPSLIALARPALEALLRASGETVFLAVPEDDHLVLVDKAESRLAMSITSPLGRRIPHCAGALGKVFHAWMDPEERRDLLRRRPLRPFTRRTIVDPAAYEAELARVRRAGVAFDDEEYLEGVRAVAAPIFDPRGRVVGGLLVVGPRQRLPLARLRRLAASVREVAARTSAALGGGTGLAEAAP
jgi:DNA-binding IclR family transcriptional regulator